MRGRTLAALSALAVVDLAVVVLGYRAHTGTLPPSQRTSEAFVVVPSSTPSSTPSPTAEPTGGVVGPALLGVNPNGAVLRATRGACEARFDTPARIWAGDVDDGVALTEVQPPLREVLGLMVYADGSFRVSGLDDGCHPVTFDSTDAGATWESTDDSKGAGIWTMSGDTTAPTVTGPLGGTVDAPCAAAQIVNLPQRRAIASCAQTTFFQLPGVDSAPSVGAPGYTELSAAPGPDGSYFVFGATADCTASLALVSPPAQRVEELKCFKEDKAPLAVASAEGLVVIQLGDDLMVSHDDGASWETVGEPAATTS